MSSLALSAAESGDEGTEKSEPLLRGLRAREPYDQGQGLRAVSRGYLLQEGAELGDKLVMGDEGQQVGEGGAEGKQDLGRLWRATLEGLGDEAEMVGEQMGFLDELLGEIEEVEWGQGVSVLPGPEGVEVAMRGANEAWTQVGVAVGATAGVAAHGPVSAAVYLAGGFAWVSRHGMVLLIALWAIRRGSSLLRQAGSRTAVAEMRVLRGP